MRRGRGTITFREVAALIEANTLNFIADYRDFQVKPEYVILSEQDYRDFEVLTQSHANDVKGRILFMGVCILPESQCPRIVRFGE